APAGTPTTKTGRLVAPCTRATIDGDGESEVIAHAAPTFCIQVPMLETSEEIQSARNSGCDSGAQADSAVVPSPPIASARCRGTWNHGRGQVRSYERPV